MALYRIKAIVLRTYKLGEADKIVALLSNLRGKVRAVAKGVRKTKSKFGGRLEPFSHADLLVYEGRNLDIVTQAETIHAFRDIRGDLDKITFGSAMLDLADKVSMEGERDDKLFSLLLASLLALDGVGSGAGPGADRGPGGRAEANCLARLLLAFDLKLMAVGGFLPELRECIGCGRKPPAGAKMVFSSRLGGVLCSRCGQRDPAAADISQQDIDFLVGLIRTPMEGVTRLASPEAQKELLAVVGNYLSYHIDSRLKSRDYLSNLDRPSADRPGLDRPSPGAPGH